MIRLAAIVTAIAIAGCASQPQQPQWIWAKPGASGDDFQTDHGYCTAQAFGTSTGNLLQVAIIQNACLKGKGWRQVVPSR